ncbi:heterokaryon incompatibility protein [Glarea lozoyensis ATCC 20868]|uniref:Heterokaryon incompatibility protein n=1 Tax=Glarea lozoyensis (strain ATCC 20868 / MF5171) TaxID=1116229 RepID=S3D4L6_GLAL2|nr:heterokaryon incompatibility protein [Glarea lozoyensis ATCC 20868]EPE32054.1 heterokaryon incompatibility protein [Glarea lozoyensis ATCC 20868]
MYPYKSLDSATNELRLLRLLSLASSNRTAASAASDDTQDYHDTEIVCELFHAFADDKPKYHALSYTWGSAEGTELISLDGIQVPVTENLADALKNIRDDHNNIVLWVDAICINQQDDAEKSKQVSRMRYIYGSSFSTIVFLGASDDKHDESLAEYDLMNISLSAKGIPDLIARLLRLDLMKEGRSDGGEDENVFKNLKDASAQLIQDAMVDLPKTISFVEATRRLLVAPYWQRIWVWQEFVVSPEVVLYYSKHRISYGDFFNSVIYNVFLLGQLSATLHTYRQATDKVDVVHNHRDRLLAYHHMFNSRNCEARHLLVARHSYQAGTKYELIYWLSVTQSDGRSYASDDRDLIFALLGIASDRDSLDIVPDYHPSTTCSSLYTSVAKKIIQSGDVDYLSFKESARYRMVEDAQSSTSASSLTNDYFTPSWVPDWRRNRHPCCNRPPGTTEFETFTGRFTEHSTTPNVSNKTEHFNFLNLKGYIIDQIEHVAPSAWHPGSKVYGSHPELSSYLSSISTLCQLSNMKLYYNHEHDPYPTPSDRLTAYFRLPVADMQDSEYEITQCGLTHDFDGMRMEYQDVIGELHGQGATKTNYYYDMLAVQVDRRPMMLRNGLVGLVPEDAKRGDVLVVFEGAQFPYVLRKKVLRNGDPRLDDVDKDDELWELVGDAYVHGVMYGELFDEDGETDLIRREFVLI